MEASIKEFLSGSGDGDGSGYGDGSGSGSGYGSVLKVFQGEKVYYVDGIPCVFISVKRDSARVLVIDGTTFETKPAFIAKQAGVLAHGEALREAFEAAAEKIFAGMDFEEKKKQFRELFPSKNEKYPTGEFYRWHHIITGSCEFGRKQFAEQNGIDLDGSMSVAEFFELTRGAYNGRMIAELENLY